MSIAIEQTAPWSLPRPGTTPVAEAPKGTVSDASNVRPLWDETELVRRAQAGDGEAFRRLYDEHGHRLYILCLRMLSDAMEAEEAMQDAFIKAWTALPGFERRSAFGTWLHRIGVNVALNALRRRKRQQSRFSSTEDVVGFEHEARQAMPDTRIDLEHAIAQLPPGQREMLILRDIYGYAYDEIAELTNVSLGTVKSQLNRARQRVRQELDK